jgi:hypothetical protein
MRMKKIMRMKRTNRKIQCNVISPLPIGFLINFLFRGNLGGSEDVIGKVLNADIPDSIRDGILNDRVRKHNTGVKVKAVLISPR